MSQPWVLSCTSSSLMPRPELDVRIAGAAKDQILASAVQLKVSVSGTPIRCVRLGTACRLVVRLSLLLLLHLGLGAASQAAEWYVDATAPPGGTGRTPQEAWRRFAEIDWGALRGGDTLHVLGDSCGPAYTEALVVGANGRAGAPLTIAGLSRSRRGAPVIDGENRRDFGIVIHGKDYVVLRGLTLRNHTEAGITVRGAREGVVVEQNAIYSGDPGGGNARGIDARGNTGRQPLIVRANRYGTPAATRAQSDGIWSSDNDGAVYESNVLVISNGDMTGHSDGIQSFQDRRITIRRNWIEQANAAPYHNHGLWLENTRDDGIIEVIDNVILAPQLTGDAVVAHYMRAGWNGQGRAEIRGNTIFGGHRALYLRNSPRSQIRDNIIVAARGGHAAVILEAAPPPSAIDGNLLWSPTGTVAYMGRGNLAWSDWRALGYDARGVSLDPRLDARGQTQLHTAGMSAPMRGATLRMPPVVPDLPNCPAR